MKRKEITNKSKVGQFYINELVRGFMGEQDEGKRMLKSMGLPYDEIPFSAATLLRNRKISWKDNQGNEAKISFILKPTQIECFGTYLDKKKSIRVFREWNTEEPEYISRVESEAIGDLCMRCIFENLNL